ncbi:MAG: AI-2E family transporter [Eubacteriales bacterium]|nr:AI-2E family transporter [Eubacteriales bacterium]
MGFFDFKNHNGFKGGNWIPYTIAACSAVLLYTIINNIPSILTTFSNIGKMLTPVTMGVVIAYLMTPFVNFINRHLIKMIKKDKLRDIVSIVIASSVIVIFIGILMSFLIPQIVDSVVQFINNINLYSEAVNDLVINLQAMAEEHNLDMDSVTALTTQLLDNAVQFVTRNLRNFVNRSVSIGGIAGNLVIGIILAIYFLSSRGTILDGIRRFLSRSISEEKYDNFSTFIKKCNSICTDFIAGDLLDAVIVGIVNFIFMTIMKMPYAVLISVVVGVTNLAPTFGPFVGAFIGAFIMLFADAGHTIIFLIFTLILQLIDGYIIKPKLFGNSLGVPGVWITVGIIVGGKFFGVIGILLSVPVVGIITYVYKAYVDRLELSKLIESVPQGSAFPANITANAASAAPAEPAANADLAAPTDPATGADPAASAGNSKEKQN